MNFPINLIRRPNRIVIHKLIQNNFFPSQSAVFNKILIEVESNDLPSAVSAVNLSLCVVLSVGASFRIRNAVVISD